MNESKIMLVEVIQYLKEVAEHEKSKRFHKFVERAIIILQYFAETDANLDLLIDILVDITDEYLRTKSQYVLVEALSFFDELIEGVD